MADKKKPAPTETPERGEPLPQPSNSPGHGPQGTTGSNLTGHAGPGIKVIDQKAKVNPTRKSG